MMCTWLVGGLCTQACLARTHLDSALFPVQALSTLMLQQQVDYDFAVYRLPMPTDVPVTILTVGRSLLHAAVDLELILNTTGKHCLHSGL